MAGAVFNHLSCCCPSESSLDSFPMYPPSLSLSLIYLPISYIVLYTNHTHTHACMHGCTHDTLAHIHAHHAPRKVSIGMVPGSVGDNSGLGVATPNPLFFHKKKKKKKKKTLR
eukprot:NODE_1504_length_532_cov_95.095238_g1427_i0.p1 GENE.NODE_1504_length_532_cov_95.095238_g1427_i0~~NODE_1504_length_532_cov_95.095238_g1427_i0.p1  ORF type:complete len:113 (+),score=18.81 NODE_1504_length_532_cov_95.095238_g1427_i0:191-529(+)